MAGWLYNLLHGWLPGSGFLGRSASGGGPCALLSGADAVGLLPAATASVDGKMTAAQVALLEGPINITGEPTGFSDSSAVTATHNTSSRTVTLGGTWKAYYRGVEVVALTSGWTSPAYGSGLSAGAYLLSYNGSSFSWDSLPSVNFHDLLICAMVKLASGLCIVLREFHGAELPAAAHMEQHRLAGAYISSGGLLSDWTANSTTAADRRPLISSASFHDEDNVSTISALTSESYTRFYLSGSGAAVNLSVDQADIIPISGNQPYYNQFTAGAWQQTLMPQGKFGAGFVIAMPVVDDQTGGHFKYRWQIVQPQSVQDTQAAAEAVDFASISLGELSAEYPEITARARIVIQYTGSNWVIKSVQTLTGTYIKGFVSSAPLAQVVTDGTTTTGSGTLSSPISTIGVKAQSGSDIELILGDSSGANKISIKNYAGTEIFNINSLGEGTVATASRSGLMSAAQVNELLSSLKTRPYDAALTYPPDFSGGYVSDSLVAQIISSGNFGNPGLFLRRSNQATGLDIWSDSASGNSYIDNRWNSTSHGIILRVKSASGVGTQVAKFTSERIELLGGRIEGIAIYSTDTTITSGTACTAVFNAAADGVVVTLILNPAVGHIVRIINVSVYALTVARNGKKINLQDANYTLSAGSSIVLQFSGDSLGWLIIAKG